MTIMIRSWMTTVFALSVFAVTGCGSGKADVTGTVKYDGKLVTHGTVVFVDKSNLTHGADIQSDGTYSLAGIPAGEVRMYVYDRTPGTTTGGSRPDTAGGGRRGAVATTGANAERPPASVLPEKYGDVTTAGLTTTLKSGKNDYNFDLPK